MLEKSNESLSTSNSTSWWSKPFSNIQTNLQEIDATMNVEETLDFLESQGADTWLINVGGIEAFYPTDLEFQTRVTFLSERLSGDLIGDACKAASNRKIRILARMDFSKVSARIAREHPEWLFISPTGKPQIYNTLYSTCPCGDYYQNRSLDIVDEILDRYPVKGFFINWFKFSEIDYSRVYHGVCHCANCKAAFAAYSADEELPDGPSHANYPIWLKFSTKVLQDLVNKIDAHIKSKHADVGLIMSRESPVIYYEANNAFGREFWPHATSEAVSAYKTAMPSSAVLVNSTCFIDMPYRMAGEQPEHFAQYLLQAIARGGNPSTYLMGAPGRIPYKCFPTAREIQTFFRENARTYSGYRAKSKVLLVRPDPLRRATAYHTEAASEFRGIYSALKEAHLPFDVVNVNYLSSMATTDRLNHYELVILPHIPELGPETAEHLDTYVNLGGHLVLTGDSGLSRDGAAELLTSPSNMRSAGPIVDLKLWATYVSGGPLDHASAFEYSPPIIPIYGNLSSYIWKPKAERRGRLLPQAPFGPPEKCYGHSPSDDPGAARLRTGRGTVLQFPWTVGRTYHEFGATEIRDYFLGEIMMPLVPEIAAQLPEQVELILGQSDAGTLIHLINQTGVRGRSFGPHVPINDITLSLKNTNGTVSCLRTNSGVRSENEDGNLIIKLEKLELFEVIKIEQL